MSRLYICLAAWLLSFPLIAQTSISGIVNEYAAIEAIESDCIARLRLSDIGNFQKGDIVLIIQMQGATMAADDNDQFGYPNQLNGAGLFERAVIDSVAGNEVFLESLLLNNQYTVGQGLQLVRAAVYQNATVTDVLSAAPWDGSTGGVLMLEVAQTLELQANIDLSERGFRGGFARLNLPNDCGWLSQQNDFFYPIDSWRGAMKGEGIGAYIPAREAGRGPNANGGGGGNDHNSGGGGGSSAGAQGGDGGQNSEPSTFGCKGRFPGLAGWSQFINDPERRIIMGGGGGAGHANNLAASHGGRGGGIIILSAGQLIGNGHTIGCDGQSVGPVTGDGNGGGGAGGAMILQFASLSGNLSLSAKGGAGGDVENALAERCIGPGGGGAGGSISLPVGSSGNPALVIWLDGGSAGLSRNSASCSDSSNGATDGEAGILEEGKAIPQSTVPAADIAIQTEPQSLTACLGASATFEIQASGNLLVYEWWVDRGSGFELLIEGVKYQNVATNLLTINDLQLPDNGNVFECRLLDACGNSQRSVSAVLELFPPVSIVSHPQTHYACEGEEVLFEVTATGAGLHFQWQRNTGSGFEDFGPLTNGVFPGYSNIGFPQVLADWDGDQFLCVVTDTCGGAFLTDIATLHIDLLPTAGYSFVENLLDVQFNNLSSDATDYLWDFGDGNTSTEPSPTHTFVAEGTYKVQLIAQNGCGADTITQCLELIVEEPLIVALAADVRAGCAPHFVQFEDQSSGDIIGREWSFPGGTPASSTEVAPLVEYTEPGLYDVGLTVFFAGSQQSIMEEQFVLVAPQPIADFDFTVDDRSVQFQNLSVDAETYLWDFGDGSPGSQAIDPQHDYASNGSYTVTLAASNPYCASIISYTVLIDVVGLSAINKRSTIRVYPNPAADYLLVDTDEQQGQLCLRDVHGKYWKCGYHRGGVQRLDISLLPAGVYLLSWQGDATGLTKIIVKY